MKIYLFLTQGGTSFGSGHKGWINWQILSPSRCRRGREIRVVQARCSQTRLTWRLEAGFRVGLTPSCVRLHQEERHRGHSPPRTGITGAAHPSEPRAAPGEFLMWQRPCSQSRLVRPLRLPGPAQPHRLSGAPAGAHSPSSLPPRPLQTTPAATVPHQTRASAARGLLTLLLVRHRVVLARATSPVPDVTSAATVRIQNL